MKSLRIAVAVTRAVVGRIDDNLDRLRRWTKTAKSRGAELICFPEMNITGYYNHSEIHGLAEPVPGDISQILLDLAVEEDIVVLAGMAERSASDNIYASHLVASPEGHMGVYRKLHIAPPGKELFHRRIKHPSLQHFGFHVWYSALL